MLKTVEDILCPPNIIGCRRGIIACTSDFQEELERKPMTESDKAFALSRDTYSKRSNLRRSLSIRSSVAAKSFWSSDRFSTLTGRASTSSLKIRFTGAILFLFDGESTG